MEETVRFSGYRSGTNEKYLRKENVDKSGRNEEGTTNNNDRKKKYANIPPKGLEFPPSKMRAGAMADAIDCTDNSFDDEDYDEEVEDMPTARSHGCNSTLPSSKSSTDAAKEIAALIDEEQVNDDLILKLVRKINKYGRRKNDIGTILVLFPGVAEISSVDAPQEKGPHKSS